MRIASFGIAAALLAVSVAQAQPAPAPTPAQGPAMTIDEGQAFLDKNKTAPGGWDTVSYLPDHVSNAFFLPCKLYCVQLSGPSQAPW